MSGRHVAPSVVAWSARHIADLLDQVKTQPWYIRLREFLVDTGIRGGLGYERIDHGRDRVEAAQAIKKRPRRGRRGSRIRCLVRRRSLLRVARQHRQHDTAAANSLHMPTSTVEGSSRERMHHAIRAGQSESLAFTVTVTVPALFHYIFIAAVQFSAPVAQVDRATVS